VHCVAQSPIFSSSFSPYFVCCAAFLGAGLFSWFFAKNSFESFARSDLLCQFSHYECSFSGSSFGSPSMADRFHGGSYDDNDANFTEVTAVKVLYSMGRSCFF
jgi:hypothetical protein